MVFQRISPVLFELGEKIRRPVCSVLERIVKLAAECIRRKLRERAVKLSKVSVERSFRKRIDALTSAAGSRPLYIPSRPFDAHAIDGPVVPGHRSPGFIACSSELV